MEDDWLIVAVSSERAFADSPGNVLERAGHELHCVLERASGQGERGGG